MLLAAGAQLWAQTLSPELPPGVLLGARVRERVKQRFAHLPEYTCLETLNRFSGTAGKRNLKQIDTVRLEVLFAGREEFFDSPGGRSFQESSPARFTSKGLIGNGLFAGYLENIFVYGNGVFQYRGEEDLEGRRVARFDFRVPSLQGATLLEVPGARANVGVAGAFWADAASYDLIRLRVDAVDIPPILQTLHMTTAIDYAPTLIGAVETLLPQSGEMLVERESGELDYNSFEFTHCREYRAESAVSFDDGAPASAATSAAGMKARLGERSLPAGLTVTIALTAPITERSVVGDMVRGKLVGDIVARGGSVLVPDATAVNGRIRLLEKAWEGADYYSVGIEFTEIDAAAGPFRFFADLESSDSVLGLEREAARGNSAGRSRLMSLNDLVLVPGTMRSEPGGGRAIEQRSTRQELPGVGLFLLHGGQFTIPAGLRMVWKTRGM